MPAPTRDKPRESFACRMIGEPLDRITWIEAYTPKEAAERFSATYMIWQRNANDYDVGEVAVVVRTSTGLEQWHVKLELTAERLEL